MTELTVEALQALNDNISKLHDIVEIQDKRIDQIWTFLEVAGIAAPLTNKENTNDR